MNIDDEGEILGRCHNCSPWPWKVESYVRREERSGGATVEWTAYLVRDRNDSPVCMIEPTRRLMSGEVVPISTEDMEFLRHAHDDVNRLMHELWLRDVRIATLEKALKEATNNGD